jgi:hypothetical protein
MNLYRMVVLYHFLLFDYFFKSDLRCARFAPQSYRLLMGVGAANVIDDSVGQGLIHFSRSFPRAGRARLLERHQEGQSLAFRPGEPGPT